MVTQLKSLRSDSSKGKSAERTQQAIEELEYLVTFTSLWHVGIAIWSLSVVELNLTP